MNFKSPMASSPLTMLLMHFRLNDFKFNSLYAIAIYLGKAYQSRYRRLGPLQSLCIVVELFVLNKDHKLCVHKLGNGVFDEPN